MATADELYPSKWLKASDCEPPIVAQIDRCQVEQVGQGAAAQRKLVAYFNGTVKPAILNKTNHKTIEGLTGCPDSDDWSGTILEFYSVDCVGPNGPTQGIRVRAPRVTKKPLKRTPAPEPEEALPIATDPGSNVVDTEVGF